MADHPTKEPESRKRAARETINPSPDKHRTFLIDSIPGKDDGQGLLILTDGSLRQVLCCEGLNMQLMDASARERIGLQFAALAAALETEIQIVVTAERLSVDKFLAKHPRLVDSGMEYLDRYGEYTETWFRSLCDRDFVPERKFYVIVSGPRTLEHSVRQVWNGTEINVPAESLEALERYTKNIFETLSRCNLNPSILTSGQLRDVMEEQIYFPASAGDFESAAAKMLSGHDTNDYIQLNGKYVAVQCLRELPADIHVGWLSELLAVGFEHTLSLFIRPGKQQSIETESQGSSVIDPTNNLDVSLYIRTEAHSIDLVKKRTGIMEGALSKIGITVARESLQPFDAWQSTLPVAVDKCLVRHKLSAHKLSTFWPFLSSDCGTADGAIIGFAADSGEAVMLNPFTRGRGKDNNNLLITGSNDASRAFAMSLLMLRLLPFGVRFMVLSDTFTRFSSYQLITEVLGPDSCLTIGLGENSGMCLNPFDLGMEDLKGGKLSTAKVLSLLSFFDIILTPEGQEELSVQEKALLDRLIRTAYDDATARKTVPTMSEFGELLECAASEETNPIKSKLLQNLSCGFSIFVKPGAYSDFLDGATNFLVDSAKRVVIFDTKRTGGQRYEKAVAFVLTQFIEQEAKKAMQRGKRLAVCVDQSRGLMGSEAGVQMLGSLSTKVRPYATLFVINTDRLKSLAATSGLDDSLCKKAKTKIFLQDPGNVAELRDELALTDAQVNAVKNLAFDGKDSRCMLIVGNKAGIVRFFPNPLDYWICTSEPLADVPKRQEMIREVKAKDMNTPHTDAVRRAVNFLASE